MCIRDRLVGCLGKIDQEAIGAAMESVTRDGSTRLGRRRAIALKKRGPFSNFRPSVGQHNLSRSACIRVPLKLIKITVVAGLYNLPLSFPARTCQDLETYMRGTRTISVDHQQSGECIFVHILHMESLIAYIAY